MSWIDWTLIFVFCVLFPGTLFYLVYRMIQVDRRIKRRDPTDRWPWR